MQPQVAVSTPQKRCYHFSCFGSPSRIFHFQRIRKFIGHQLRRERQRLLCICLGEPPKTFTFEYRDADDHFHRETGLTPKRFFEKYVGVDLSDYVSLINAPTADKPYGRSYTVRYLGNVKEGRPVRYLNLPIEELKKAAIAQMQALGLQVVMLTGDNAATARHIGAAVGLDADHVIAGVLPAGKEAEVRALQKQGRVAMVGDGINDAPALTRAETGIAIGAGADVALDAADVVLVRSDLADVPAAVRLSRAVVRNIHQNLFWAFFYNAICIPLAAGVFISLLGWKLNPMFGAAAMSLSSFCVVSNALRLNLFRLRDGRHDRALHPVTLPDIAAQPGAKVLTMRIDGMMCAHCEARVKAALEAVDGVQSAAASHEAGTAVVTLKADADENALKPLLKAVVEENDYEVKGFDK